MAMQAKVRSLTEINNEITRLTKQISMLRKQAKEINSEITNYLVSKDEIGFKCDGNALILDKKTKPVAKNKKSKEESYISFIEKHGIENPKEFLQELLNSGKDEKEIMKLKIQKINK